MNQTIWKYNVKIDDVQTVAMPEGAKLLSVQVQHNLVTIWAMVDPRNLNVNRIIQMAGTGHDMSERIMGDFLGTFQIESGALVFHVFDGGEE